MSPRWIYRKMGKLPQTSPDSGAAWPRCHHFSCMHPLRRFLPDDPGAPGGEAFVKLQIAEGLQGKKIMLLPVSEGA